MVTIFAMIGWWSNFVAVETDAFESKARVVSGYLECFCLTKWHQYIFSVSLKFEAYYITGQWVEFIKKCYLMLSDTLVAFFVVFHHEICVFIIFISFFDEVSNFRTEY